MLVKFVPKAPTCVPACQVGLPWHASPYAACAGAQESRHYRQNGIYCAKPGVMRQGQQPAADALPVEIDQGGERGTVSAASERNPFSFAGMFHNGSLSPSTPHEETSRNGERWRHSV